LPPPANALKTYQAHADILTALERRDGDLLCETMTRHYDGIQQRIRQTREHLPKNEDPEEHRPGDGAPKGARNP
jgi:DNA-binding FadR family transcriptional regulator